MSDEAEDLGIIEVALDQAFHQRPVNTTIHEPYLIARFMEHPVRVENTLEYHVQLQDIGSSGTRSVAVRFSWTDAMIPATPLAAQREYITESAAYGLVFAAVPRLTSAVLFDTAPRGDRFDYVLAENGVLCGIELSGTQTEERQAMRDRHQQKIRQLLDNPLKWGGYVAVVGFARRELILSYHQGRGE